MYQTQPVVTKTKQLGTKKRVGKKSKSPKLNATTIPKSTSKNKIKKKKQIIEENKSQVAKTTELPIVQIDLLDEANVLKKDCSQHIDEIDE